MLLLMVVVVVVTMVVVWLVDGAAGKTICIPFNEQNNGIHITCRLSYHLKLSWRCLFTQLFWDRHKPQ
jgi:hypothetical protein